MNDRQCIEFLQWVLPRLELRWAGFRKVRRQVCRRLAKRLRELGLEELEEYRERLRVDQNEWALLDRLCRVTISRFFRDRGVWEALGESVLPDLARGARDRGAERLEVWSAGCASGEEPYSLAILWRSRLAASHPDLHLRLLATDRDLTLLARARRAIYPSATLREADALGLRTAFRPVSGGEWALARKFRRPVRFAALDLRSETPAGRFDLILCRNLAFTYFDERLQRRTLDALRARLVDGGALAIGSHERLPAVDASRPAGDSTLEALGLCRF